MKRFVTAAILSAALACPAQVAMKQYKSLVGADYVCVTNYGPYLVATRAVADSAKAVADAAAVQDIVQDNLISTLRNDYDGHAANTNLHLAAGERALIHNALQTVPQLDYTIIVNPPWATSADVTALLAGKAGTGEVARAAAVAAYAYSPSNPPPGSAGNVVTSVNGLTGTVTLTAADVGAVATTDILGWVTNEADVVRVHDTATDGMFVSFSNGVGSVWQIVSKWVITTTNELTYTGVPAYPATTVTNVNLAFPLSDILTYDPTYEVEVVTVSPQLVSVAFRPPIGGEWTNPVVSSSQSAFVCAPSTVNSSGYVLFAMHVATNFVGYLTPPTETVSPHAVTIYGDLTTTNTATYAGFETENGVSAERILVGSGSAGTNTANFAYTLSEGRIGSARCVTYARLGGGASLATATMTVYDGTTLLASNTVSGALTSGFLPRFTNTVDMAGVNATNATVSVFVTLGKNGAPAVASVGTGALYPMPLTLQVVPLGYATLADVDTKVDTSFGAVNASTVTNIVQAVAGSTSAWIEYPLNALRTTYVNGGLAVIAQYAGTPYGVAGLSNSASGAAFGVAALAPPDNVRTTLLFCVTSGSAKALDSHNIFTRFVTVTWTNEAAVVTDFVSPMSKGVSSVCLTSAVYKCISVNHSHLANQASDTAPDRTVFNVKYMWIP